MSKTLFHPKWHSYNKKASELDEEVRKAIEPIIEKWIDDGYSPREMESIMMSTMSMAICVKHMYRNGELLKKERAKKKK
jgi:hypothetical protein